MLAMWLSYSLRAQNDTTTLAYRYARCMDHCHPTAIYEYLKAAGYQKENILRIGTYMAYHSHDACANAMMKRCLADNDSIRAEDWHAYSVQNTKNGNYAEAIMALDNAEALDATQIDDYYGWVLLYYYRDYARALTHLERFDALHSGAKAPVGENIHFLKGLCFYQLKQFDQAIAEFTQNEAFEVKQFGQKNCNGYIYFYMARCYHLSGDLRMAKSYYEKAIAYTPFPTEADYYLGLLYRQLKPDSKRGTRYLEKAKNLLMKGYKQQDIYVELFDEVYLSQVNEALTHS